MWEAFDWLRLIGQRKRRLIVWLRASGLPVRKVARIVGLNRRSIWWHNAKGIEEIKDALNLVRRKVSNGN